MADITELGKKVKAKYPGQYDDLDDTEVGRRVKAKFPGAYDDFSDPPNPTPAQTEKPGFFHGLGEYLVEPMVEIGKAALGDPMATSRIGQGFIQGAILQPQEYAQKTVDSVKRGDWKGAVRNAPGMVPIAGPMAEDMTDKVERGEYGRALGNLTAIAAPTMLPKATGAARSAKAAVVRRIERVEPTQAMVRALKPKSTDLKFTESVNNGMADLKAAEGTIGRPIQTVQDLGEAVKAAKKSLWSQIESMSPNGMTVNLNDLAVRMRKAGNVEGASAVRSLAEKYKSWDVRLDQLEKDLAKNNADLNSYYGKYPSAQRVDAAKNPDTAGLVAEGNALRDAIYNFIDSDSGGAAPRALKKRYGNLMNIEREVERRVNVADRQAPQSLSEQVSKWSAAGGAVKGGAKVAGGLVSGNPGVAWSGAKDILGSVAEVQTAKLLKELNTTNSLIRRAFKQYKGQPEPIQMPSTPPAPSYGPNGPPNVSGGPASAPAIESEALSYGLKGAKRRAAQKANVEKTTADTYKTFGPPPEANPNVQPTAVPDTIIESPAATTTKQVYGKFGPPANMQGPPPLPPIEAEALQYGLKGAMNRLNVADTTSGLYDKFGPPTGMTGTGPTEFAAPRLPTVTDLIRRKWGAPPPLPPLE